MKKIKYMIFIFVVMLFAPLTVCKASDSYVTSVINSNGTITKIGDYSDYTEAKKAAINYDSNSSSVSVVYRNNKIVYAEYGIARLKSGNVVNLYADGTTTNAYTSTHSSYGTEAAFIDYDSTTNRSKIKISGYTGYANADLVEVVPISSLTTNSVKILATTSINVRKGPGTSFGVIGSVSQGQVYNYYQKKSDGLYTWYNINYNGTSAWIASGGADWTTEVVASNLETYYENYSTGNIIHYYKYSTGQGFTNLGTSPSYLKRGTNYYSFDGNYFYTNLVDMLDDYRNNSSAKAINSKNPFYSYYMYLPNHSMTKYTADDFNQVIISKGYNSKSASAMYGEGSSFIASQDKYGVNAMLTFAAALNESASGTSWIAKNKNNLFGHGAYDSCPTECAVTYATVADGILAHARMTGQGYNDPSDWRYHGSHYGNKASGMNVKYATDPYWGEKAASNAFNNDKKFGSQDFKSNTVGVKRTYTNVPVRKQPNESSSIIYTLKNNSYSVEKIPLIVFDKVSANGYDWYKVYTDMALDENQNKTSGDYKFSTSYGYVRADYLDVENNQPTITAIDKEIDLNSKLDLLTGVSASDKEDGTLTNRIEVTDNVDITRPGTYQATYTVEDNSRFSVSKTINVIVKGVPEPVINANDREISQYTTFDPKEGVSATDIVDGDITSKIEVIKDDVKPDVIGEYEVTYSVTNSYQKTVTKTIKVKVVKNAEPVIIANDKNILLNSTFNNKEGVTATDKEDGDLTSSIVVIKDEVKTGELGTYQVTYQVTDKANQTVTKTINVNVVEKALTKKDGWFHLEKVSFDNDQLEISGFNIIKGVNNRVTDNIKHQLILKNQDTGDVVKFDIGRWTNNVPFVPNDGSLNKYDGSWFEGKILLKNIAQGDYTMYIRTESLDYYTEQIISNMEYTDDIKRKYNDSNNRGYMVKENPVLSTVDLELFIRDNGLITYGKTPVRNGVISDFFDYSFVDGKLNLVGNSYALKTNYDKGTTVEREIILEDKDDHNIVYRKSIGSITDGPYKITSNTNNDLTRAWFKASVDLGNLEKGNYIIYIKTKVNNVEDYSELVDYAYSDLSSVGKIGDNTFYLKRNSNQRIRLELVVN